jgi:tripartite motif-containing protein 71
MSSKPKATKGDWRLLSILNLASILFFSISPFIPNLQKVFAFSSTDAPVFLEQWGGLQESDNGKFSSLWGITADSNDNIYVSDSSHHRIQKFDSFGNFITKWGSYGTGDGQLYYPEGMAIDSNNNVYVADSYNHRIQKFDSSGNFLTKWGSNGSGDGQFSKPFGVAVDSNNNIYVADTYNNRIQKFDSSGNFLTKWGSYGTGNSQFKYAYGVGIDSSNNVYVVDRSNNRIQKFDSSGNFLTKWGSSGSGDGQFNYPRRIAADVNNNIYITDTSNQRIQKFDSSGNFITKWGSSGSGDGQFNSPYDITSDSNNNVYVTDSTNQRVQKFDSSGNFITKWGSTTNTEDGQFFPAGSAIDSNNNVYVADASNTRIQKFDSSGNFLTKWGSSGNGDGQFNSLFGVATDSNNNVYAVDMYNNRIQKFDSSGNFLTKWGSSGSGDGQFKYPTGIALDSNNNVYVSDYSNYRIQKFDSSGNFITKWGGQGAGNGQFKYAFGVGADSNNNIYVADTYNNRIQKFDSSGNFLTKWGSSGSGDGQFSKPFGVTTDSNNNVYVADTYNNRIQKFDSSGNFLTKWGSNGSGDGQFNNPRGGAIDSGDNVYVSDSSNYRLQKFSYDQEAPSLSLTTPSSPGNDSTPDILGTATDTLTSITSIEYQIDGTSGSWSSCTASDGTLDETGEKFTCSVSSALSDGTHTVYVRATDSKTNTTTDANAATATFTTDTTNPASFSLISPLDYTKDEVKPSLSFKKSSDATAGLSSYTVTLDDGKNKSYSTTGIPSAGNGSASYVWKDDSEVKIEFLHEDDSDSANDEIRVYFKGLDSSELTEGKHSWQVIAYDSAGNSTSKSQDFYLDKTLPSFSELAIADVSSVSDDGVYNLDSTNRTPSFLSKASDSYQGSEKTNDNGTKDTFDKVCSGPEVVTLSLKRLKDGENPDGDNPQYTDHLSQDYSLTDIQDDSDNEKYAKFFITTPYPLVDGYYQVNLSLKDKAGNTYDHSPFYLSLNYSSPAKASEAKQGQLETEIIEEERIPAETEAEKEKVKEEGYLVKVKVVDEDTNPIKDAKVTLHSEPRETITDENGEAIFEKVEPGEHQILIAYQGQIGEQQVNLEGEVKGFAFTVQVKPTNPFLSSGVISAFGFLLLVIAGLLLWVFRMKKVKKEV